MVNNYCLKKGNLTKSVSPKIVKTKYNRLMKVSKCASCGVKKLGSLSHDYIKLTV